MHYFSTNRRSPRADFRETVLQGQPDDNGLYFPETIAHFELDEIASLLKKPNAEIGFAVISPYVDGQIPESELFRICSETVDFEFPMVAITDRISTLELFHGPTLAFKDVGARFMSRCLCFFSQQRSQKTIVIAATSGDTGGAVANGFYGMNGIEVVILYPKGRVSLVQEQQLTTLGGNITAIELDGSFDDCQRIAKALLADTELKKKAFVTSANSINVARWLPQQFYYFFAMKEWDAPPPVVSVPSGNFGNVCAGLLANASGLPVELFIAACNANDVIPRYMGTGRVEPMASVATLSNAMDVGDPSNFVRVIEIFHNEFPELKKKLASVSVSDSETKDTMRQVFDSHGYVLDPHGAVGYKALSDHLGKNPTARGFFLETAHPVKFESVVHILGTFGSVPESVAELNKRQKQSIASEPDTEQVKEIVLSKI